MNILYWITTGLISLFLLVSAGSYLFHTATIEGVKDLGFPNYFIIQLAVLKIIATIILIVPLFKGSIKEWAYAGVTLFLITAFIAHIAHKDSISLIIALIGLFILLGVSYSMYLGSIF